jgi:hypothetical protein
VASGRPVPFFLTPARSAVLTARPTLLPSVTVVTVAVNIDLDQVQDKHTLPGVAQRNSRAGDTSVSPAILSCPVPSLPPSLPLAQP